MLTRRQFLKLSAAAAAGLAFPLKWAASPVAASATYSSPAIAKWAQALPGVGPGGIPVAAPDPTAAPVTGVTHYTVNISQFTQQLHPSLGTTTLRGYNPTRPLGGGTQPQKHLGGIIVAQKGTPIQITFTNTLPPQHILPVDTSDNFPDAKENYGGNGHNGVSVHLHGGFVPWISDGGPMSFFTPAASGGTYGPSVARGSTNVFKLLNPNLQPGQGEYYYPNNQSARMMWYHDHAHDITRLNAYSGIATAYILRDSFEAGLKSKGLPEFVENSVLAGQAPREIPIVIQDKVFVGSDLATVDTTWPAGLPNTPGSLWYPHEDPAFPYAPAITSVPEMFGDTMLANGVVYPEATVEARWYRLRILNACQSAFLNLQLFEDNGSGLPDTTKPGPDFLVIGTEGGFLSKPTIVHSNGPLNVDGEGAVDVTNPNASLLTGPAERWDVLVNFRNSAGKKYILYHNAPGPFPAGDSVIESGTINGPDNASIMRFNVVARTGADDPAMQIDTTTDLKPGIDPALFGSWGQLPPDNLLSIPGVKRVRMLTLNEGEDTYSRLIQTIGTNEAIAPGTYGRFYMDASTENPTVGDVEVWQIVNLTADSHPIHFHLVNVQLLSRRPFGAFSGSRTPRGLMGSPVYNGPAVAPDATELGWKETVKMHPGQVTTVIMKFDLPSVPGVHVPNSLNPNLGVEGHEYVWHCHILEHEEHDMMRPFVVLPHTQYLPFISK